MKCPNLLSPKKQGDLNALFPHDTCCRSIERGITFGFRPGPRHARARVGSFRCRGHAGRKGCLLPPIRSATLSPWLLRLWIWLPTPILWLWLQPTLLRWLWIWASLALLRGRNTDLNSRVNRSWWRKPRQGRIPPPDQPAGLRAWPGCLSGRQSNLRAPCRSLPARFALHKVERMRRAIIKPSSYLCAECRDLCILCEGAVPTPDQIFQVRVCGRVSSPGAIYRVIRNISVTC